MKEGSSDSGPGSSERAARDSESLLLGSLGMALYSARPSAEFGRTWMGEQVGRISGFSNAQFAGKASLWAERIHPEDAGGVMEAFGSVFSKGNLSLEYRWLCADGTYRWFRDSAIPVNDEHGKPREIIGNWLDITDRKRAEEKLIEQAALLQVVEDAMIVMDLQDSITFWNRKAELLYGWRAEEALGRTMTGLLLAAETPEVIEAHRVLINTGEYSGEMTFRARSGGDILCHSRWKLISDDRQMPRSIFVTNTDIRERKRFEAQIMRAQRMESISTLAAGIAHDLNNIFAPILMGVSFLKDKPLDEQSKSILATIESNTIRGSALLRQVHTFAKGIEGEKILIQPKHLIRDTEDFITQTFPKSLHIHTTVDPDLWSTMGDPTQLQQVLLGLCVNARDAMPKNGTLRISATNVTFTDADARRNLEVRPGNYVSITVADSGKGIPPDMLEKLFVPYFVQRAGAEGPGLSLPAAHGIVRSLGGRIDVKSTVEKGSEFTVYLPAAEAEQERQPGAGRAAPGGHGELILVVDDETAVVQTTQSILEANGYRSVAALDGTEAAAIFLAKKGEISLVLTDALMPYMDGATMTRALQKIDPDIGVVFMSGLPENKIDMETAGRAVRGYLQKPFTVQNLLVTIDQALHGKSRHGRIA